MIRRVIPAAEGPPTGRPRVPPANREGPTARWTLRVLATAGVVSLAALAVIVLVHLDDRFELDHNPGAWMAQARAAEHGTLMPPLFDGEHVAGTRYQPPLILVLAGLTRVVGGDPILAWKLLALAGFAALAVVVARTANRLGADRRLVLGALAAVAAAGPGYSAAVRSGADAIPFAVGLAAIGLLARRPSVRGAAWGGGLAALAILIKASVVWPALVGVIWLLGERRLLARFAAAGLGAVAVGCAAYQFASGGRWWQNMRLGASGGADGISGLGTVLRRFVGAVVDQETLGAVALVALAISVVALVRRRATLLQLAVVVCAVTTMPLFTDIGVSSNHLVDLTCLGVLVLVEVVCRTDVAHARMAAVGLAAVAVVQSGHLLGPFARAVAVATGADRTVAETRDPFGALVPRGARLLSEDPTFPVLRGQAPTIGDPFMARRLFASHPAWRARMQARIRAHEFDRVVLYAPGLRPPNWYRRVHLGTAVADTIRAEYAPLARRGVYMVYRPR